MSPQLSRKEKAEGKLRRGGSNTVDDPPHNGSIIFALVEQAVRHAEKFSSFAATGASLIEEMRASRAVCRLPNDTDASQLKRLCTVIACYRRFGHTDIVWNRRGQAFIRSGFLSLAQVNHYRAEKGYDPLTPEQYDRRQRRLSVGTTSELSTVDDDDSVIVNYVESVRRHNDQHGTCIKELYYWSWKKSSDGSGTLSMSQHAICESAKVVLQRIATGEQFYVGVAKPHALLRIDATGSLVVDDTSEQPENRLVNLPDREPFLQCITRDECRWVLGE
jgi:hypothetical protein